MFVCKYTNNRMTVFLYMTEIGLVDSIVIDTYLLSNPHQHFQVFIVLEKYVYLALTNPFVHMIIKSRVG